MCQKTFSDCSNLTKHRRTHERDYPQQDISALPTTFNLSAEEESAKEKPEGKAQVWNIINEATSGSSLENQLISSEDNMQQIIYVSYEPEQKGRSSEDAIDLGPLSNLQLPEVVSQPSLISTTQSQPKDVDIQMLQALEGDESTSNLQTLNQERTLVENQDHQAPAMVAQEMTDFGEENSYVDVKLKEGERPIRILVPRNLDPMQYAAEYLQQIILPNAEDKPST